MKLYAAEPYPLNTLFTTELFSTLSFSTSGGEGDEIGGSSKERVSAAAAASVMVTELVSPSLERQRRRSEGEMEKREGMNWIRVAMEQRIKRAVKRILSSAAQFHITPTNIFLSP